ncbi:MAG: M15 family metallopeptidase [Paraglaciecola sp.]|nr:M15 family metallopeptidase [Paraglaciecola sp.]NCT47093.1 M15 family metallopeptidase [Paraglaciecola sp.]
MPITSKQLLGLDASHLVPCGANHQLQAEVAQAFRHLQAAAQNDGIDCQIVSSYRSFAAQQAIWQQKWCGQRPLLDIDEQVIDGTSLNDEQKLFAILTWSALPGASRHHWGTDLDVYDQRQVAMQQQPFKLVNAEYCESSGPCFALNNWLSLHAEEFGFYRPYEHFTGGVASEAWHVSYAPLAKQYLQNFDLDALLDTLCQVNIAGIDSIKKHALDIYHRFILNHADKPRKKSQ